MFKLKAPDGTNNLCGKNIEYFRKTHDPPYTQRGLAKKIQLNGHDVDNHFIRRIENGQRFVTDIEISILAQALDVNIQDLFELRK